MSRISRHALATAIATVRAMDLAQKEQLGDGDEMMVTITGDEIEVTTKATQSPVFVTIIRHPFSVTILPSDQPPPTLSIGRPVN